MDTNPLSFVRPNFIGGRTRWNVVQDRPPKVSEDVQRVCCPGGGRFTPGEVGHIEMKLWTLAQSKEGRNCWGSTDCGILSDIPR